MAVYIGSKKDFHKFFGARLRNIVQITTKKYRRNIGKCEFCESEKDLEAAHTKGFERVKIIDAILNRYLVNNTYQVNLNEFENHFIEAHNNLQEVIKILCKECHLKYDEKNFPTVKLRSEKVVKTCRTSRMYSNSQIQKLISSILHNYSEDGIINYLNKTYCKEVFNINYPLLIKAPKSSNLEFKRNIVKDKGKNRWSWKYSFQIGDFNYAICTQWYDRNDDYFTKWYNNTATVSK